MNAVIQQIAPESGCEQRRYHFRGGLGRKQSQKRNPAPTQSRITLILINAALAVPLGCLYLVCSSIRLFPTGFLIVYQKHLASALLAAGLSQTGYIKAVTIMSLEDVLKVMENDSGEVRNPELYYFSVFGTPSNTSTWGYRVEGHHLSQNCTVVNGEVVDGPSFFGANPAQIQEGHVCAPCLERMTSDSN